MTDCKFEPSVRRRLLAALAIVEKPGAPGEAAAVEAAIARLILANAAAFRTMLTETSAPPWPQPTPEPGGWRDLLIKCLARSDALKPVGGRFLRRPSSFRAHLSEAARHAARDRREARAAEGGSVTGG